MKKDVWYALVGGSQCRQYHHSDQNAFSSLVSYLPIVYVFPQSIDVLAIYLSVY